MDLNLNVRVPAVEKLIDYAASGLGAVVGSILAPWIARQQGKALTATAQAEAESRILEARGQADSLTIIAEAQSEARAMILPGQVPIQAELTLAQTAESRLFYQEEKRERNIRGVLLEAADELGNSEVPNDEPDHDWVARFFNEVQDVSSEQMQALWARVLAGQVRHPGSVSVKTLSVLRDLDQETAELFQTLCSICIYTLDPREDHSRVLRAMVPSMGLDPGKNEMAKYGLNFSDLNRLTEHGLIVSDYDTAMDYQSSIGMLVDGQIVRAPFACQDRFWILVSTEEEYDYDQTFFVPGIALTVVGTELLQIVGKAITEEFLQDLESHFEDRSLTMEEAPGPSWTFRPGLEHV